MSDIAIQFDHVGKLYRLGNVGSGTLFRDLDRWWKVQVRHKEDPFLKVGEVNDRATKGHSDSVWALKDITFDVHQGDVVGIIGRNGAGKSTLLKLLSRITAPTSGTIRARGRIASLLEVGTGFHGDLTGRENLYMNGSIMGMTRHEINSKLDEIVDFAGVARYLDTPVKRYSSGMTVRLGFAVAAFLEPEILVVDEVLAVGDAEFQKKAIGKMQDVSRGEGRTVLFVSHNMAAVRSLCTKGVVLENGIVVHKGTAEDSVQYYLNKDDNSVKEKIIDNVEWISPVLKITKIMVNNKESASSVITNNQTELHVSIEGTSSAKLKFNMVFTIKNNDGVPLASYDPANSFGALLDITEGDFKIEKNIKLPSFLSKGILKIDLIIHHPRVAYYLIASNCCILDSLGGQEEFGYVLEQKNNGLFALQEA